MSINDPEPKKLKPEAGAAPSAPRLVVLPEPWTPARATERIRAKARESCFTPSFKHHAFEQMDVRGITASDVMHVLKNGIVYKEAEPATQALLFRYAINSPTPNSNGREIRIILIPSPQAPSAKIITVMWADER